MGTRREVSILTPLGRVKEEEKTTSVFLWEESALLEMVAKQKPIPAGTISQRLT